MILGLKGLFLVIVVMVSCINGEDRKIYIVVMEGDPPVAFREPSKQGNKGYANELTKSHDEFLQNNLEGGSYRKLYSFKHVVNGMALHTTPSQIEKLKKNGPRVKLVEQDRRVKLMTTYTPQFLGIPAVWAQGGGGDRYAGEGIVMGFVDSGINPEHPSFADDPTNPLAPTLSHFTGACEEGPLFPETSCNGKIISARFFSAGAQSTIQLNDSIDVLSPFDVVGHGSHVASTAAGNFGVPVVVNGLYYGRATGIAPRARIAVYKAIYPSIGTLSDVLAAIDQAVLDGVNILTLSIGPDEPAEGAITFLSLFEIFMLAAHKAGTFIVQAAGNEGPGPYSVISYSPWVVGVASGDTDRTYPGTLILGNGTLKVAGVGLSGPTFGGGVFQYKLVLAKDGIKKNGSFPRTGEYIDECQHAEAFDPLVVQGSVVICTFSSGFFNATSSLTAIIDTAKLVRFKAFVFVANATYGDFIAEPIPFAVPGIMIPSAADTQRILQYYERETERDKNGNVIRYGGRAAISEGRSAVYKGRAPVVSRFSSRGPDYIDQTTRIPADVLKPDILAPGHQIWAAWSPISIATPILYGHNFALMSGTSMATPHVAGIAALIKQYNPSWTPSMIASAISTTASTYDNLGEPLMAYGFDLGKLNPSAPFGFGAGFVNASRALDPGLVFSAGYEDYISFLCSLPNIDSAIVTTATGGICDHFFNNPSDLNLPSITITALAGSRLVHRTVKSVASKTETYLSAVLPPRGVIVDIQPSWFRITPGGTQDLHIRLNVTQAQDDFSFGQIILTGSLNHVVKMPLSILPISTT